MAKAVYTIVIEDEMTEAQTVRAKENVMSERIMNHWNKLVTDALSELFDGEIVAYTSVEIIE